MDQFPDVSEHQGDLSVDWFKQWPGVIIRAHSGYRYDHKFQQNWQRAKAAGIPRGVYGYVVPERPAAWQAAAMVDAVASDPPELGYWSDLEQRGLGPDHAWTHFSTLPVGRRGVYANGGDYNAMTDARFDSAPWWGAGYPNVIRRGRAAAANMVIHQYQGSPLDMNRSDVATLKLAVGGQAAGGRAGASLDVMTPEQQAQLGLWMQEQAFNQVHVLTGINKATYDQYLLNSNVYNGGVLGQWLTDQRTFIDQRAAQLDQSIVGAVWQLLQGYLGADSKLIKKVNAIGKKLGL